MKQQKFIVTLISVIIGSCYIGHGTHSWLIGCGVAILTSAIIGSLE